MSDDPKRPEDALPASESGTGIIPEDEGSRADVGKPASEDDAPPREGETPQSWPGKGFGTIPPPG